MAFQTSKLHEFRGQQLALREISQITGISRVTLKMRALRGSPLDAPLSCDRPKKRPRKPRLTGDWQRDVEGIVQWMHQRLRYRLERSNKA